MSALRRKTKDKKKDKDATKEVPTEEPKEPEEMKPTTEELESAGLIPYEVDLDAPEKDPVARVLEPEKETYDFEHALSLMHEGKNLRRVGWNPEAFLTFYPESHRAAQAPTPAHMEITLPGGVMPYEPKEADLEATDWEVYG